MSRECVCRNLFAAAVAVLATAALTVAAAPELAIEEDQQSFGITWSPGFAFERAFLIVGGPTGVVLEKAFEPGDALLYDFMDGNGLPLLEGYYSWALHVARSLSPSEAAAMDAAQADAVRLRDEATRLRRALVSAGAFSMEAEPEAEASVSVDEAEVAAAEQSAMSAEQKIEQVQAGLEELNGRFIVRRHGRFAVRGGVVEFEEAPPAESPDYGEERTPEGGIAGDGPVAKATNPSGNHFVGTVTATTGFCASCTDGEVVGTGYHVAKGNAPAFDLIDQDNTAVWWIQTDSTGDFALLDYYTGNFVATIQKNAPANSLFIESDGDITMGSGSWFFRPGDDGFSIGKGAAASEDIEIWDAGPGVRLYDTSDGTYGTYYYNSPNLGILGNTSQYIAQINATAPANSLVIGADGDVGIGGDPDINTGFVDLSVIEAIPQIELARSAGTGWTVFERASGFLATCTSNAAESAWTCPMYIYDDAPWNLLNLTPSGVGIGTSSPTRTLHVVPPVAGSVVALFQNGTHEISRSDGGYSNIRFATSGGAVNQSYLFQNSPVNGEFVIRNETTPGNPLRIQRTAPSNSLVITGVGVGIGTGSPAGKLDVNGSIYQRGGLIHADYVFEPGYELPTIEEHARLMWDNSHLPAVPPREVDEAGLEVVNIGAQRRGILEELEVAHIYIEQLEKRMAQQEERLNQLEALLAEHK